MLKFLYNNIGKKVKGIALMVFIVSTIAAVIFGIRLLSYEGLEPLGLLILIGGPISALIVSWLIYAFGDLVENTEENKNQNKAIANLLRTRLPASDTLQNPPTVSPTSYWVCEACATKNADTRGTCWSCGKIK